MVWLDSMSLIKVLRYEVPVIQWRGPLVMRQPNKKRLFMHIICHWIPPMAFSTNKSLFKKLIPISEIWLLLDFLKVKSWLMMTKRFLISIFTNILASLNYQTDLYNAYNL